MRPIDSSYDRQTAASAGEAEATLARHAIGDVITYDEIDQLDDIGWREVVRPRVEEVPGDGYRLVR